MAFEEFKTTEQIVKEAAEDSRCFHASTKCSKGYCKYAASVCDAVVDAYSAYETSKQLCAAYTAQYDKEFSKRAKSIDMDNFSWDAFEDAFCSPEMEEFYELFTPGRDYCVNRVSECLRTLEDAISTYTDEKAHINNYFTACYEKKCAEIEMSDPRFE